MPDSAVSAGARTDVRFADLLRNRGFLRLWLVQAFSQTGQNMTNFALLILVRGVVEQYQIQQANTAIGLAVLSFSVPAILFSPVAGVVVERANKRTVLIVTNALRGLAVVGFLVIQPSWRPLLALSVIYTLTFASGAVGQFFGPALGASIPLLVGKRELINANALFNLTFTISQIAGFAALGPFLIKVAGLDNVLLGIVLIFVACALISLTIPSTPPSELLTQESVSPLRQMFGDMREGIVFIFQTPILIKAIAYLSLATASYLMVAVLGPEFASGVLKLERQDLVYIVGPAGLGIIGGGLAVGRFARRLGSERTIDLGLTLAGTVLMLLALVVPIGELLWISENTVGSRTIAVAAALAGLLGLANALILIPSQSFLQSATPEHIRARVYATFYTVSNGVAFIPIIFAGALADLFGVVKVLVGLGLLLLFIGVSQLTSQADYAGEHQSR